MLPEKSLGKKFSFVASDGRHWTSIFLEKELRVSVFHEIGSDTTCTGSKEALRRKKTSWFLTVAGNSKRNLLCYLSVYKTILHCETDILGFSKFSSFFKARLLYFIPFLQTELWLMTSKAWSPSTYQMHERTKGNYIAKTLAIRRVLFLFQSTRYNVMIKTCAPSKTELPNTHREAFKTT